MPSDGPTCVASLEAMRCRHCSIVCVVPTSSRIAAGFNPRGRRMTNTQTTGLSWFTPHQAAYLLAALASLSFAYDLMQIPIQVSDSLVQMLDVQRSSSPYETFVAAARRGAYLRPMFLAYVDVLFDVAQGHYWLVYRGFHALLLTATLL